MEFEDIHVNSCLFEDLNDISPDIFNVCQNDYPMYLNGLPKVPVYIWANVNNQNLFSLRGTDLCQSVSSLYETPVIYSHPLKKLDFTTISEIKDFLSQPGHPQIHVLLLGGYEVSMDPEKGPVYFTESIIKTILLFVGKPHHLIICSPIPFPGRNGANETDQHNSRSHTIMLLKSIVEAAPCNVHYVNLSLEATRIYRPLAWRRSYCIPLFTMKIWILPVYHKVISVASIILSALK